MKHLSIFRLDFLVKISNWVGVPVTFLYIFSMLVFPFIREGGDWVRVQSIWDRWQALNVGMLAFLSSVIAFNISKFNADRQREREFIAARAFLPHALSELTDYFRSSALVLIESWRRLEDQLNGRRKPLESVVPNLPEQYKEIFSNCIKYAEPDVGEYLAKILVRLQIHHSRLKGFAELFGTNSSMLPLRANAVTYLIGLGELQALVNNLYEFARGTSKFEEKSLTWDDYRSAYAGLDVEADEIRDLVEWTRNSINRA